MWPTKSRRLSSEVEEFLATLAREPGRWDELKPLIGRAAARCNSKQVARRLLEVYNEAWDDALRSQHLTRQAEERPWQIAAGLGFPPDQLTADIRRTEQALIARANAGRFPTIIDRPHVACEVGETFYLEFPAAAVTVREERKLRGDGISVPVGHGPFRYTVMRATEDVTSRRVAGTQGVMSVSDRRVVFRSDRAAREIRHAELLELKILETGLVFLLKQGPALEFLVPVQQGVAAVINLAAGNERKQLPTAVSSAVTADPARDPAVARVGALARLVELREQGELTPEEFAAEKARLLAE